MDDRNRMFPMSKYQQDHSQANWNSILPVGEPSVIGIDKPIFGTVLAMLDTPFGVIYNRPGGQPSQEPPVPEPPTKREINLHERRIRALEAMDIAMQVLEETKPIFQNAMKSQDQKSHIAAEKKLNDVNHTMEDELHKIAPHPAQPQATQTAQKNSVQPAGKRASAFAEPVQQEKVGSGPRSTAPPTGSVTVQRQVAPEEVSSDPPASAQQSAERKSALQKAFASIDSDSSNTLDKAEVGQLMTMMGKSCTGEKLDAAMRELDHDGSGTVDFAEFQKCVADTQLLVVHEADRAPFCVAQRAGTGTNSRTHRRSPR